MNDAHSAKNMKLSGRLPFFGKLLIRHCFSSLLTFTCLTSCLVKILEIYNRLCNVMKHYIYANYLGIDRDMQINFMREISNKSMPMSS